MKTDPTELWAVLWDAFVSGDHDAFAKIAPMIEVHTSPDGISQAPEFEAFKTACWAAWFLPGKPHTYWGPFTRPDTEERAFRILQGRTIKSFMFYSHTKNDGLNNRLFIETECGAVFSMHHDQECCEDVRIEEVHGDPADVEGAFVSLAEESSNEDKTEYGSLTWTFYKIATPKGDLTIRWKGESNGYYSESVSFVVVDAVPEHAKQWRPSEN